MNTRIVSTDILCRIIDTANISRLVPVARKICNYDYAVKYYYNPHHPKFYKNQQAFRHALKRCVLTGQTNGFEIFVKEFDLERDYILSNPARYIRKIQKIGHDKKNHCFSFEVYLRRRFGYCPQSLTSEAEDVYKEALSLQAKNSTLPKLDCAIRQKLLQNSMQ